MSNLEIGIMLLVEMTCGAAAAIAVARLWRGIDLDWISIALIGMLGGVLLTVLASYIPVVDRFVGRVEHAADSAMRGAGGLTLTILIGVGVAGLLGGAISISLVGFLRRGNASRK